MSSTTALLLPLCTSSASLGLALFQFPLFASFLDSPTSTSTPPTPAASRTAFDTSRSRDSISGYPLSRYWKVFFPPAASLIAGSVLTSFATGLYTYRSLVSGHPRFLSPAKGAQLATPYLWGAIAALGHLAFAPLVAGKIGKMIENGKGLEGKESYEDEGEGRGKVLDDEAEESVVRRSNERMMRSWLVVHGVRTCRVDLVAVVCFCRGVFGVLGRD